MGAIDIVYPTLPSEILNNYYRTWIWENSIGERIAIWDSGNTHCEFMCEGTPEAIIKDSQESI
ncbi:hypothetical protein [Cytobacillus horneckiae]|uniref:hypothetical protein n=1 Tax=Cytobacillus horneckiae TaxID=549687 RepID=UPI0034CDC42C